MHETILSTPWMYWQQNLHKLSLPVFSSGLWASGQIHDDLGHGAACINSGSPALRCETLLYDQRAGESSWPASSWLSAEYHAYHYAGLRPSLLCSLVLPISPNWSEVQGRTQKRQLQDAYAPQRWAYPYGQGSPSEMTMYIDGVWPVHDGHLA